VRARNIDSDADLGPLVYEPPAGIHSGVLTQLRYMYDAGAWVLLESAIADLPADLRWLYESGAVSIEQLGAIHRNLGATSAADLGAILGSRAIRALPGFEAATEANIAAALPGLRKAIPRLPLGRAMSIAAPILSKLRQTQGVQSAGVVGSLRRGHDSTGDIELVAPAEDTTAALAGLAQLPDTRVLHRSERRIYLLTDRVQIGIRFPHPDRAGAALLHLTGSRAHFDALRALADAKGWSLGPEGLTTQAGGPSIADSEEAIYAALGLPWIPPEIRDTDEAIVTARANALPTLISRRDIRGDLHMHTQWSDGRDTADTMVKTCVALGYQYMAITDHSPHSAASRTLSADSVGRQAEEIAGLRAKYPAIAILHGCEVDILPNGRLDFPDKVLERFDIVLASLHEEAGHSPEQLYERYVGAMRHPLVTIITHPTNRQMPHRPGYDLDYDRLFALAAETGTVVEIDGAPSHLDLNGVLARKAAATGALISIDSDGHRAEVLDTQMDLGVLMARNGWIESRHVLNTRPLDEVRATIAAKRSRSA
jgi:DNA polymerase (family 10)